MRLLGLRMTRRRGAALGALALLAGAGAVAVAAPAQAAARAQAPCLLKGSFGARTGSAGQSQVAVVLRNDGFAACTLRGFPEVELIGPADPDLGAVYALPRQQVAARTVVLRPGQKARFTLTWLPAEPGGPRWLPGYLRVVIPASAGSSASFPLALAWRLGAVMRQDGATHPGTFVGPLAAAAR